LRHNIRPPALAGAGTESNGEAERVFVLERQWIGRDLAAGASAVLDRIAYRIRDAGQAERARIMVAMALTEALNESSGRLALTAF
jgi:hypothetical protein